MGSTDSASTFSRRQGFTLLELLAAMGILVLMVMLLSSVFTETIKIWGLGQKRISAAAEGRVVMDFLVREMSMAIADDVISFKLLSVGTGGAGPLYSPAKGVYDSGADEIFFVGLTRSGSGYYRRTANQYAYFISPMLDEESVVMTNRYRLVRTRKTRSMFIEEYRSESAYSTLDWWTKMPPDYLETDNPSLRTLETVAENVSGFEIWAYSEDKGYYQANYYSPDEDNQLPLWLDIYVELLGEDDAIRAAILWDTDKERAKTFINESTRRYTARVYFQNRARASALNN